METKKRRTNCPNCGAPIASGRYKCEYCGTQYLNVEMFELYEDCYIRINIRGPQGEKKYVTVKANLRNVELEIPQAMCYEKPLAELTFGLILEKVMDE